MFHDARVHWLGLGAVDLISSTTTAQHPALPFALRPAHQHDRIDTSTLMIELRSSADRGYADHGWLRSFHSFSFADYYDPRHMGFGPLRVINEDRVQPGKGFGMHGHRDMEIISYVLGGAPSYEQKHFDPDGKRGQLRLIASPTGEDGSVMIHQDVRLYASLLTGMDGLTYALAPGRRGYIHVARGRVRVNGERLTAGDALKAVDVPELELEQADEGEVLVFDLP